MRWEAIMTTGGGDGIRYEGYTGVMASDMRGTLFAISRHDNRSV